MSFFNRLMYSDDGRPSGVKPPNSPGSGPVAISDSDDLAVSDGELAAQLPPENTLLRADGVMESMRHPIVSINGRDVSRSDENHNSAA